MSRAMWSGNISFGLVTIPVSLHAATEGYGIAFHQLHKKCDTRIQEHRYCPHCDTDVEWEDIVKGYEYKPGKYVEITKDDLESLPLPSKHTIDVSSFVAGADIDPIYYDKTYYVDVEKGSAKAYTLLLDVLQKKNLAAVATVAFRNKERLCAVRAMGKALVLQTLLFDDEIRENEGQVKSATAPSAAEKKMAETLVNSMIKKFEPVKYKDHYDAALKKLVQSKLKGTKISLVEKEPATGASDLMEALKRSLESRSGGKSVKTKSTAKSRVKKKTASKHGARALSA